MKVLPVCFSAGQDSKAQMWNIISNIMDTLPNELSFLNLSLDKLILETKRDALSTE